MSWTLPPEIYEDEDEEAIKSDFVRLCALYPKKTIFDIASYVFESHKCRDREFRANQAALRWSNDIAVQERIRLAALNRGIEPQPIPDKQARLNMLQGIFEDTQVAVKERIAAARLIAEIEGEIVKSVDKKLTDTRPRPRQIIFKVAPDE